MTEPKPCRAKGFLARVVVIAALVLPMLLSSVLPLGAQESVDPRSGRLLLTTTDLVLQAGAITLEIQRTLATQPSAPGLLGARWRMNWESRLRSSGQLVLVEEAPQSMSFTRAGPAADYVAVTGARLRVQPDGRVVRANPDGTADTFDAQGRLIGRDYQNGNTVTLHYGADGRLARIEGPGRQALQFIADPAGRVTRVETSTGVGVRYTYFNDNLTEVQVNGRPSLRYTYDATGALVRIDTPATGAVELAYDGRGRVLSRRWADATQERFEYDDAAQRERHVDPAGAVTTIQWSQDKRKAEITNALGHKRVIEFDAAGRPLSATGPTAATARIAYDQLGRVVTVENPLRQVTRFAYLGDSRRVKSLGRPDGSQQAFEYDSRGNLTGVKVGAQTVATFTYHPNGSVATTKGFGVPESRSSYYPDGRLKSMANALGQATQYEYDRRGNLIREINPLGGVIRRRYDVQDRLVDRTDPGGGPPDTSMIRRAVWFVCSTRWAAAGLSHMTSGGES